MIQISSQFVTFCSMKNGSLLSIIHLQVEVFSELQILIAIYKRLIKLCLCAVKCRLFWYNISMNISNDHLINAEPTTEGLEGLLDDVVRFTVCRDKERVKAARNEIVNYFNEAVPSLGKRVTPEDFWAWLRIEIDKNNISTRQFAQLHGIAENTISKICNKTLKPSETVLNKLGFIKKEYYIFDEDAIDREAMKDKMRSFRDEPRSRATEASIKKNQADYTKSSPYGSKKLRK